MMFLKGILVLVEVTCVCMITSDSSQDAPAGGGKVVRYCYTVPLTWFTWSNSKLMNVSCVFPYTWAIEQDTSTQTLVQTGSHVIHVSGAPCTITGRMLFIEIVCSTSLFCASSSSDYDCTLKRTLDFCVSGHIIAIDKETQKDEGQSVLIVAHSSSSALVCSVGDRNLRNNVVVWLILGLF